VRVRRSVGGDAERDFTFPAPGGQGHAAKAFAAEADARHQRGAATAAEIGGVAEQQLIADSHSGQAVCAVLTRDQVDTSVAPADASAHVAEAIGAGRAAQFGQRQVAAAVKIEQAAEADGRIARNQRVGVQREDEAGGGEVDVEQADTDRIREIEQVAAAEQAAHLEACAVVRLQPQAARDCG